MKKTVGALLFFLLSSALKGTTVNPLAHLELARLKASLAYVRAIKTVRLLFLSLLGMGVCLTFLLAGLVLFHVTLFLYAPWSAATKCFVGLSCSLVYLAVTVAIFYRICASEKWLEIFHADTITSHLKKESEVQQRPSTSTLNQN